MLHNTFSNILDYSYPIGNTSAVHLTEQLAWEQDADILLAFSSQYIAMQNLVILFFPSKSNANVFRTWKA